MMTNWPFLSLLMVLPLVGSLLLLLVKGEDERAAARCRFIALSTTLATFALSLVALSNFDASTAKFQLQETHDLIASLGIKYALGVDGISMALIMLTTFLMPIAILASSHVAKRVRSYFIAFLVLETLMIGTFAALDIFLFYALFEGVLIPMYLIIGVWGGPRRIYASFKFFIYTLLGSILMLLALIVIYLKAGSSDLPFLMANVDLPKSLQVWLWLAFLASFAVKLPMWPMHTWLPDAHVEAPTAGSVILAGVLLKMGGYGFLRFSLPMLPEASWDFAPLMWILSIIAIIYTSLVALAQEDMKKMIAYSSVAHMGFVTLGLFSFNRLGVDGAMFQMISHGVVSGALFMCIGVLYDRMHTRSLDAYGGVAQVMPKFAVLFMIMMLASVGLPGTSGFVGEFMSLAGMFTASHRVPNIVCEGAFAWSQTVAVFAALGIVLGAAYMLWLYRKVMYGEIGNADVASLKDVTKGEFIALGVLVIPVIWLGFHADTLLHFIQPSVDYTLALMTNAQLCNISVPAVAP